MTQANSVEVAVNNGRVVLRFVEGDGVRWYGLEPDVARRVSEEMRLHAKSLGSGEVLMPIKPKDLTPQKLAMLTRRAQNIIKSGLEKPWPLERIAQAVAIEVAKEAA